MIENNKQRKNLEENLKRNFFLSIEHVKNDFDFDKSFQKIELEEEISFCKKKISCLNSQLEVLNSHLKESEILNNQNGLQSKIDNEIINEQRKKIKDLIDQVRL